MKKRGRSVDDNSARAVLQIRLTPNLREMLKNAAKLDGITLSREVRFRLITSFDDDPKKSLAELLFLSKRL